MENHLIELRLLRYFVAVAEEGSVSRASQVLHMGQPSLSRQLRVLERRLGLQLFRRGSSPLQLTPSGIGFLPTARDLLMRHDQLVATAQSMQHGEIARLRIAASSTTIVDVLAPFIAKHRDSVLQFTIIEAKPDRSFVSVENCEADLALSITLPPPNLAFTHVADFFLYAYVSAEHPWCLRSNILLEELAGPPLILTPSSGSFHILIPAFERAKLQYVLLQTVPVPRIALALAASGRGIAVLSDDPFFELHALTITSTESQPMTVPLFASWDPSHYGAEAITRFVAELQVFCAIGWPMRATLNQHRAHG